MRTITINVTKRDIEAGKVGNCSKCPIALAVKRINKKWWVGTATVFGILATKVAMLPKQAVAFIDRFDNRQPVKPFSFKLRIP